MTGQSYDIKAEISTQLTEKIKDHAALSYPHECCGILLGSKDDDGTITITDVKNAVNRIHGSGRDSCFAIDPLEIYRLEKETEDSTSGIIGFYHSHPDKEAVLSMADKRGMIPGQLYVLVSVCSSGCRNITAWCRTDETIKEAELNTPLFAR